MVNLLIIFIIFIEINILQNYVVNNKNKGNVHTTLPKNKYNFQKKKERKKRAVIKMETFKWNFPIKYHIKEQVGDNVIDEAIKLIEKETCIIFNKSRHRLENEVGITFRFHRNRCGSYIGKQRREKSQPIFLSDDCKERIGTVLHEISHALGMYHEVSRNDRAKYVKIIRRNVRQGSMQNFAIYSHNNLETFGISYDLGSVMHYYLKAFSANGEATVLPLDQNYNETIGQRVGYTFNDVKSLNYLYCNNTCSNSTTPLKCHNYGYRDPKNCSQCKCPLGFAGVNCTILKPQSDEEKCGTYYFNATSTQSTLNRTGIMNCTFHIKAENAKIVNISVTNLIASPAPNSSNFLFCFSEMALEIKHKKDTSATGLCLCGNISKPINITSEGDEVHVMWYGKATNHTFTLKYIEADPPSNKTT